MNAVAVAKGLGAARLGLGVAMVAVPPRVTSLWVGRPESRRSQMALVTRAFGAREILLGALALHVADRPAVGRRLFGALALCDLTDLTATIAHRDSLPATAVPMMVAVAGGAFASQLWASRELP